MKKIGTYLWLACLLAVSAPAVSQEAKKEPWYISTRAEYSACLDEADRLEKADASLEQARLTRDAQLSRHEQQMQAHAAMQASLDLKDGKAVEEFNARMRSLNTRTAALNIEGAQFNQLILQHREKVEQHHQRCAGIKVGTADMKTVQKIRAKQAKEIEERK